MDKASEISLLEENAQAVKHSVGGLTPEDAMNALGAVVAHMVITNWPRRTRTDLLDAWYAMVRRSVWGIDH